jgi:hypothetical protein
MDKERGKIGEGRLERQGPGFLQRRESGETRVKSPATRGRQKARLFLREDDWHEEKVDQREDRERPKLPD